MWLNILINHHPQVPIQETHSPMSPVGTPVPIGDETPSLDEDNSSHIPILFSASTENSVVISSPVHLPYDSINLSNNDNYLLTEF